MNQLGLDVYLIYILVVSHLLRLISSSLIKDPNTVLIISGFLYYQDLVFLLNIQVLHSIQPYPGVSNNSLYRGIMCFL